VDFDQIDQKISFLKDQISKMIFDLKIKKEYIKKIEEENFDLKKKVKILKEKNLFLSDDQIKEILKLIDFCIEYFENLENER
jgi:predicted transcriptional regulator